MRHVRPDWSLFVGAALLVCLLLSETVPAAQKRGRLSDTQKELQEVQRELTQERRRAQDAGRREGALARDLERVEALLTAKTAELKRLEAQVGAESREVAALTQELARGERRLDRTERLLGERLRAVYKQGRLGTVRVLLTAGTAEEAARRVKYLTAIAIQDRELAARHRMALAELTGQRETVRAGVSALAGRRNDLREARQEIASEQWRRRILLAKVREEKQGHLTAIRELETAANELQALLNRLRLEERARRRPAPPGGPPLDGALAALRGQLPWPTAGQVVSPFGRQEHPKFRTVTFNRGVGIRAGAGQEIRAVHRGTVAFADWFQGYGRLAILDHGEGLFTLYAHLADLLVRAGQEVQAGQLIGTVGESGSLDGPQLYFEVRVGGKPEDPLAWLRPRP
ncbi:MAG: murein hydrolase activator EnvC family protein [Candidatus Methylomirabilales bacterium]